MDKREKVINGLELCLPRHDPDCDLCPYDSDGARCRVQLMDEAIELLKTQEPRTVHVTADINRRKIGECPTFGKLINSGTIRITADNADRR